MLNMSLETVEIIHRLNLWAQTARPGDAIETDVPPDETSDYFAWVVRAIVGPEFKVEGRARKCHVRRRAHVGGKRVAGGELGTCPKRLCP